MPGVEPILPQASRLKESWGVGKSFLKRFLDFLHALIFAAEPMVGVSSMIMLLIAMKWAMNSPLLRINTTTKVRMRKGFLIGKLFPEFLALYCMVQLS